MLGVILIHSTVFFNVPKVWCHCIVVSREAGEDDPDQRSELPLHISRPVPMSAWGKWVHSLDTSAGCLKLSVSGRYKAPGHCYTRLCFILCFPDSFCIFHGTCARQRKMHSI